MAVQIKKAEANHAELLWALSDGSRLDMEAWDRVEITDLFMNLQIQQARIKRVLNEKNKGHGNNRVRRDR